MPPDEYGIYVAERPYVQVVDDVETRWHHACLILMDERHGPPAVVQQLHFNDWRDNKMTPNVREGITEGASLDKAVMVRVGGGSAQEIFAQWNHGLRHALNIKKAGVEFGKNYRDNPYAANSRSGIVSTLKAIGIEPQPEFFQSEAGTKVDIAPVMAVFSRVSGRKDLLFLLKQENKELIKQLLPPWEDEKQNKAFTPTPADLELMFAN